MIRGQGRAKHGSAAWKMQDHEKDLYADSSKVSVYLADSYQMQKEKENNDNI